MFYFLKTVLPSDNGLPYKEGDLASCVERDAWIMFCKGIALLPVAAVMDELPC